ncbi:MAG: CHAT domain-containing protein, partial [Bacteroidota bacterium]
NRCEESLGWLDKASQINRQINPGQPRQNHQVLLFEAEALTRLHRFDEAIATCQNVLETSPIPENKKQSQATLAAVFFEEYHSQRQPEDLENAWQNYLAAIATLDSMRFTYQSSASRIQQSERNFHLFEGALEVCEQRQDAAAAFWVVEKSKAQALLENHRDDLARRMAGLPDSLLRIESGLKNQIAELENTAFEAPPGEERQTAEASLFEKKQSLNALLLTFERDYPAYFRLKYNASLASAAEVQASLPDATALLEYYVGDSSIFIFTLTKNSLRMSRLPKPAGFEKTIEELRNSLTDSELRFLKKDVEAFAAASGKLYDWLLAEPLAALPPEIENLVVTPDGALGYLPFEILGKSEKAAGFKAFPYLLKKFNVSYAASANLLLEQSGQKIDNSEPLELFAGFAPSYSDADTLNQLTSRTRALLVRDEKYNLPGAALEVQEIAALLGGKTWLGDAATEGNFKRHSPHFQILHLAMHSIADDANPLFSKLLFTQTADSEEGNDLNANELYAMRLPARLVVLSACNTGSGKLRRGEGIMSLSRAFSFAGVPATVMSLWQAPDEATRQVMVGFYKNLKAGLRKDEALRRAKLTHLESCEEAVASPFFWAGFVAGGNSEALFGK